MNGGCVKSIFNIKHMAKMWLPDVLDVTITEPLCFIATITFTQAKGPRRSSSTSCGCSENPAKKQVEVSVRLCGHKELQVSKMEESWTLFLPILGGGEIRRIHTAYIGVPYLHFGYLKTFGDVVFVRMLTLSISLLNQNLSPKKEKHVCVCVSCVCICVCFHRNH